MILADSWWGATYSDLLFFHILKKFTLPEYLCELFITEPPLGINILLGLLGYMGKIKRLRAPGCDG